MCADGHGPRATSRSEPAARPTSLSIAPTEATRRAPIEPRGPRSPRKPEGHLAALRHEPSSAVPDDPVEYPVEESPKTWERPSPNLSERAVYQGFRWWRGQDLNLRPSGYEALRGHAGLCRLVPESAVYLRFRVPARPTRSRHRRLMTDRPLEDPLEDPLEADPVAEPVGDPLLVHSPAATASIASSAWSTSGGSGTHPPSLRSMKRSSAAQQARLFPSGSGWFHARRQHRIAALS